MAKVTVASGFALRMDLLSVEDLYYGDHTDLFSTFNSYGDRILTGINTYYGDRLAFTMSGLYVDMLAFEDWAYDDDTDAALAVMFRGSDNLTGGAGADYLEGFGGHDTMQGGSGNDSLIGGAGNDKITGASGNDYLHGGTGYDTFIFSSALSRTSNVDRIADFSLDFDAIALDNAVFRSLRDGNLSSAAFRVGSAAADSSDRIIYNKATGALLYDADGVGGASAVQFATLNKYLQLAAVDFVVI
jgi:Ca2+-binding RTX toxin-like protein